MAASFGTGPHICNIHDFETDDVEEWNDHCEETGHTEEGECLCSVGCGRTVSFKGIPYQRITPKGKGIEFKCEDCMKKSNDLNASLFAKKEEEQEELV